MGSRIDENGADGMGWGEIGWDGMRGNGCERNRRD